MTTFQKIIKYGAIVFAIYLSVSIIGAILMVATAIFGIKTGIETYKNERSNNQLMIDDWSKEYEDVENLDIDLAFCKLEIKEGEKFKVDTKNVSDKFECELKSNKLIIKDSKMNNDWYELEDITPEVIIYMPKDSKLYDVTIKTGINETRIENLECEKLDLEMGIGRYEVDNLVSNNAEIEAGAGETIIKNSEFERLKLDGGIGKLAITSKVTNNAEIDSGIGKLEIGLIGNKEDYKIKAELGLGNLLVDGNSIKDNQTIYNGNVNIEVEAGVGETEINTIEQRI